MLDTLKHVMDYVSLGVALLAVAVVLWGVILAVIEMMMLESGRFRGNFICRKREYLRHHLGSYLLIGLEFLIAADIIHSIIQPDINSLITLGVIVAIRTILSFFLNKELAGGHDCAGEDV